VGSALDNVVSVYVDGVVGGRPDAVPRYVRPDVLGYGAEHTGNVIGRLSALAAFQRRFVQPVRGFSDGDWAVLQSFQSYGYPYVERIVFDLVRADRAGRIAEWWSVASAAVSVSRSGHSQLDGPMGGDGMCGEGCGKALVAAFCREVLIAGRDSEAGRFVSAEVVDHAPEAPKGAALRPTARYQRVHRLVGRGAYVATVSEVAAEAGPALSFDLYRLEHGKIVERWNTAQPLASKDRTPGRVEPRPAPATAAPRKWRNDRFGPRVASKRTREVPRGAVADSPPAGPAVERR
jgi:predicted SnoaL-like aldol condensation-catalyzing enzyme